MINNTFSGSVPLLPTGQTPQTDSRTLAPVDPTTRASYDNIFFQLVGREPHATLSGANAKPFFLKSNLSQQLLAQIWALSDIDKNGALDRDEFAVAYHLCQAAIKGIPLPQSLPQYLVPQSKAIYYLTSAAKQEDWVDVQNYCKQTVSASLSQGQQQYTMPLGTASSPSYFQPSSQFVQPLTSLVGTPTPSTNYTQALGNQQPYLEQSQNSLYQQQSPLYQQQQHFLGTSQSQSSPVYLASSHSQQGHYDPNVPHGPVHYQQPESNILFFDGTSTDSTGQLVFVPAPLEVRSRDLDASNTYALGAGVSFEQRVALTNELGDAMKKVQQKKRNQ